MLNFLFSLISILDYHAAVIVIIMLNAALMQVSNIKSILVMVLGCRVVLSAFVIGEPMINLSCN